MEKRTTMKEIIELDLKPIAINLFNQIRDEGFALELDGIPAFNPNAQFVGGMLINMASFVALELINTEKSLKDLGDIIRMASSMEMNTWGILGSISGLCRLHNKGLLERVVDEDTLSKLKQSLDWRKFVDVEKQYALTGLPTNYYGVAFNIACCREALGWETEEHSTLLLNHLLKHIERHSGNFAFMDETDGDGRFDRYSIVVPGELASTFLDAGADVPEKICIMLDRSAHLLLQIANERGYGISYGRSIGVFGDTAVLGIFTAAAKINGILSEEELEIAYGYSMKVMQRVVDFWYDKDMKAINIWEHGRKTENYRDKNRILSETLGVFLTLMNTYDRWKTLGFGERKICSDFTKKLNKLATYTYITFAESEYKRGLAIIRDKHQVWMLPLINGSQTYYDKDAYMPIPYQSHVLQGVPEWNHCQLVPQLIMESGEVYMPLAYTTEITHSITENQMIIECEYGSLRRMKRGIYISEEQSVFGAIEKPEQVTGACAKIQYTFTPGCIKREDCFFFTDDAKVKEVRLVFLTFSDEPEITEKGVHFNKGIISSMHVEGYDSCSIMCAVNDGSFDTPQGRLNHEVTWTHRIAKPVKKLKYCWSIEYST